MNGKAAQRLRNALLTVHTNALAFSELVTLTPLLYPAMLAPATVLTGFCFALDPSAFDDGGEFGSPQRRIP